jgi:photosystem II PsbX protein
MGLETAFHEGFSRVRQPFKMKDIVVIQTDMMPVLMTITPSLNGFFIGLIAGGVVLAGIAGGVILVSRLDTIQRS